MGCVLVLVVQQRCCAVLACWWLEGRDSMALLGGREEIKQSLYIHLTLQMTRMCAHRDVHVHQQPCACIRHVCMPWQERVLLLMQHSSCFAQLWTCRDLCGGLSELFHPSVASIRWPCWL